MENIKYQAGTGELKNWLIEEAKFDVRYLGKCEAIYAQGNGYLGVRHSLEEAYPNEVRNMFVAGTFNKASAEEVTELPNLPDMTGMTIEIDGHAFNLLQGKLCQYKRIMNLRNGEVVREVEWESPTGITVKMVFRRVVSLADEHIFAVSLDLLTDKPVFVAIETGVDGSVTNSGVQHFKDLKKRIYEGRYLQYLSKTNQSDIWVAQHAACVLSVDVDVLPIMGRRTLMNRYHFCTKPGEWIHFEKVSAVHTSRDQKYEQMESNNIEILLGMDGLSCLKAACLKGYQGILAESTSLWEKYWQKNDITIKGNADFDQLAVRFALYHLNIMTKHNDNRVGIGAKGLTGEGYKGHSFWDTELFVLPYFMFTDPDTAKTLLEYRYNNLPGAHRKAKENGYEGAMFPWECAWVNDGEVTPRFKGADVVTGKVKPVLTGMIEHHITADIAYAVWQYYLITDDQEFMQQYGYEMILDTALFWASRVQYNVGKDRYEILDVIGPDEYKEHVDNNAYTNYMAEYNMRRALDVIKELLKTDLARYQQLDRKMNLSYIRDKIESCIDKMYLPGPNEYGIIPQTDQYLTLEAMDLSKYKNSEQAKIIYRDYNAEQINHYMVSKQADTVMLLFLLEKAFDEETKKKNFVFYEDKTLHDSSLSKCIHAIVANDLGFTDMAYNLYSQAIRIDVGPQMKSSDEGIHSAAMGGIWESTVMGYGGVRLAGEMVRIFPRLPEAWEKLTFPLYVTGCPLRVTVTRDHVAVENQGHKEVTILLGQAQEPVTIAQGQIVKKLIRREK